MRIKNEKTGARMLVRSLPEYAGRNEENRRAKADAQSLPEHAGRDMAGLRVSAAPSAVLDQSIE